VASSRGKEDDDGKDVEEVVHRGRGERTAELHVPTHVSQGGERVGDRGPQVGTHDHRNRLVDAHDARSHQADDDRGRHRRRLDQHGGEQAYEESTQGIRDTLEEAVHEAGTHGLEATTE